MDKSFENSKKKQDPEAHRTIRFKSDKCRLCARLKESWTSTNVKTILDMADFNFDAVKDLSKKIVLTQQPSENLTLRFSISADATINPAGSSRKRRYEASQNSTGVAPPQCNRYTCDLSMTFANHLHDVSQDYGYEVDFEIHVKSEGLYQKVHMFSRQQMRKSRTIKFEKQQFCMNTYEYAILPHLCCHIRRFNVKDDGKSSNPGDEYVGITLLKSGFYSDVSLDVGDKIFPAHKHVLSSRSDIFKAMFSHAQMTENVSGVVAIFDIDSEVVEQMLHYLYTGRATNLAKYARPLFSAADKYQLDELRAQCEEQLLFDLNCKNLAEALELAGLYEVPKLKDGAMAFLRRHLTEVAQEKNFQQYLCHTLDDNTLVHTLKLCETHKLASVKAVAFDFIKNHVTNFLDDPEFMELFDSHPCLMKEIFIHMNKQK